MTDAPFTLAEKGRRRDLDILCVLETGPHPISFISYCLQTLVADFPDQAAYVGTEPEAVARVLRRMESRGLVKRVNDRRPYAWTLA